MTEHKMPLYQLFTRLRQADLPLGVDDYALLLQAIKTGRGLDNREALARLCRALWLKSNEPGLLHMFRFHFDQVIPQFVGRQDADDGAATSATGAESDKPEDEEQESAGDAGTRALQPPGKKPKNGEQKGAAPALKGTADLEAIRRTQDEIQEALAQLKAQGQAEVTPQAYYSFTSDYLPVTRRQMKQHWRYLRRPIRDGPPVELDVAATVDRIAREGLLTAPVMRPRRVNRTELVLLLDQGGSMVPFHRLSQRLADTAVRGGRLGKADIYYFHDCPSRYFYKDPHFQEYELLADRLEQMHPLRASVLIFSDAGAARGHKDIQRAQQTRQFVERLKQSARYIGWLNPMPKKRWAGSTAGAIAQFVSMFEINPLGLQEAIKALRGRRPHAQEGAP